MARPVTHKTIVDFHKDVQRFHKSINGFYRFNWNEITGALRSGVPKPALLLESHSSELDTNPNGSTTFNSRAVSFLLLDDAVKADAYTRQEDILDEMENIGLDIISYLEQENKRQGSWLYNLFDRNTVKMEKVGPIFGQLYGWNILYQLKNKESMVLDLDKWDFNAP